MAMCCLVESGPPSSDSRSDVDDDTNLEIPKLSIVLSERNCTGNSEFISKFVKYEMVYGHKNKN